VNAMLVGLGLCSGGREGRERREARLVSLVCLDYLVYLVCETGRGTSKTWGCWTGLSGWS